jgi:hypothetical protein
LTTTPSEAAAQLCARVRRLTLSSRDPEAFHVEKDLIARELHTLSISLRGVSAGIRLQPDTLARHSAHARAARLFRD